MKIFGAGLITETNSFSSIPTGLEDYIVWRPQAEGEASSGQAAPNFNAAWEERARAESHDYAAGIAAFAQPAGKTVAAAHHALRDELLAGLEAALPVDIVLLHLHGAMIGEDCEDCEQDLLERVRALTGPGTLIGVLFDLHCHLSDAKLAPVNIALTYKHYPHTDIRVRMDELFGLSIAAARKDIEPVMALFDCRMLGFYPTSREPLTSFVRAMTASEQRLGILSVSLGHGFPLGDVPHGGAKLLVVADGSTTLAEQTAEELGRQAHALRREIGFETISAGMETSLAGAMRTAGGPIVAADQADNVGGGAPGDSTFVLRWLVDHEAQGAAVGIIYDPEVVALARRAGSGARLKVRLGGKLGPTSGDPIDLEVEVKALLTDYMHALPQAGGEDAAYAAGDVVWLRTAEIEIVASSRRCQCFSPKIFTDLGIEVTSLRLIVPKSYQHFRAGFEPIASQIIYMATPGAVPPDPRQCAFSRLATDNLYPWIEAPHLVPAASIR